MSTGNPHFMKGLMERRLELLTRLTNSPRENWSKVKAKFAFEYGVTKPTVEKYFTILNEAGLLEETK